MRSSENTQIKITPDFFAIIRRGASASCGAAAEFSQGRKPLGRQKKTSRAPEGRQREVLTFIGEDMES
jgi:hypothetical protein